MNTRLPKTNCHKFRLGVIHFLFIFNEKYDTYQIMKKCMDSMTSRGTGTDGILVDS